MRRKILKTFFLIICLAVPFIASAQDVRLAGTIKDADTGEGVTGASVLVKGTSIGGVADLDGNFSLTAPAGAEIVVSSIGYEDYVFKAGPGMEALAIGLHPSAEFLDDVVVVGYGSVKKVNLTGAVDQIDSEVFEGRPVNNTTQMLVGSVPNLNITLADGKPGRSASYNIRGATSIGGGGSAPAKATGDDIYERINAISPEFASWLGSDFNFDQFHTGRGSGPWWPGAYQPE